MRLKKPEREGQYSPRTLTEPKIIRTAVDADLKASRGHSTRGCKDTFSPRPLPFLSSRLCLREDWSAWK